MPERRLRLDRSLLLATLASLALALLYTRQAVLNLTQGVIGGDVDGFQNLWNFYWLKTALLDLHQNPYYTNYIYYPTGTSLRFHTLNPLNGLLTLPFNLAFGYVPSFNLLLAFSFFLTCVCAFLLVRDFIGEAWAAFAGAALFTYASPIVLLAYQAGQTERVSVQWLPLYLFFMFRAVHGRPLWAAGGELMGRDGSRRRLYVALAAITLLALSLTDWQYLMYTVLVSLLYFLFTLFSRRGFAEKWAIFLRLAAIGGLYSLVAVPTLLWPMLREALASPWLRVSQQSIEHSIDIVDLVSPGLTNPGYLALSMAGVGLWAAVWRGGWLREAGLFWALAVILFYIMALGPVLIVNGEATGVRLPYSLFQDLPLFSAGRDPRRFSAVALLGISILAAVGLRSVTGWLVRLDLWHTVGRSAREGLAGAVTLIFVAVSLWGFMAAAGDATATPPDYPAFYHQLARDPDRYAILELPLFTDEGKGGSHYMMYQSLHNKYHFSGRLARDRKLTNPNNFVKHASLFRRLWLVNFPEEIEQQAYPQRDILERTDYRTLGVPILNYYDVRYIVLYKEAIEEAQWPRFRGIMEEMLGSDAAPSYDDDVMTVYSVPESAPPGSPLTLDVGSGWYDAEVRADGVVYRLADRTEYEIAGEPDDEPGEFYTMNLSHEPLRATLEFTAYAVEQPRTLHVLLNGEELHALRLAPEEGPRRIEMALTLPPGNNRIALYSPEPGVRLDNPADRRLLSFGVYDVRLYQR